MLGGVFRILERVERKAAYLRGKGYLCRTPSEEVRWIYELLGAPPRLAMDIGGNIGAYTAELR